MEIKKQLIDNMNESFDDKVADIADLVGEKGEVVRDRLKTLNFRDYIELSKAVKQNDMEDARRILGLGIEETKYYYDGKVSLIKKDEFDKIHKDFKNDTPGEERMVILDPESGATISVPVKFMNEQKITEEKCRYCGGDCPDDPNHACDGYIGDIDNLYGSYDEDDEDDLNEDEKKIAADIKDYVDDHKKHFDAYPMDVEVDDKIYDYDEYWKMLDKYYPVKEYNTGGTQGTMSPGEMRGAQAQAGAEQGQETNPQNKTKKAQAMQRLGKKNLGGATAQQAADALDKAGQGKPLTPIQRKAMAQQAASVDQLAADPKTAVQFRNLLNKLNNQGK
tara:strand:- start:4757 stop:5758 length:1002 start_codon:yes stop_codon:yes gene_type:complete